MSQSENGDRHADTEHVRMDADPSPQTRSAGLRRDLREKEDLPGVKSDPELSQSEPRALEAARERPVTVGLRENALRFHDGFQARRAFRQRQWAVEVDR